MAEKLGLGNEVRELKIGQSFTSPKSTAFHTVRYDFKPASVDTSKKATVDVGNNHQVTVTVPHLDGAGTTQTVFKGSQRPYTKECVLVIDRVTGEITLERLGCNIQVKKTRSEYNKLPPVQGKDRQSSGSTSNADRGVSSLSSRSATPPMLGHRVSSKTKVTSGSRRPATHLMPKHSPLRESPTGHPSPPNAVAASNSHSQRSPTIPTGSNRDKHVNNEPTNNPSTLASLPMIGIDDFSDMTTSSQTSHNHHSSSQQRTEKSPNFATSDHENGVGEISDSSSSSSDSDSDSEIESARIPKTNGYTNGIVANKISTHLLNEDLCLSESGSDSD